MNKTDQELIYEKIKSEKKSLFQITPNYIKNLIESKIDVKLSEKTRKRPYPYYRFIYFRLCKDFTKSSLTDIGYALNPIKKFDHATVLNGLKKFDEFKDQNWFQDYYTFYKALALVLYKEKSTYKDEKELITVDDVKQYYKIQFIKMVEKYRSIINRQSKQIYNLKTDDFIKQVSALDKSKLEKLKPRFEAFLLMNK